MQVAAENTSADDDDDCLFWGVPTYWSFHALHGVRVGIADRLKRKKKTRMWNVPMLLCNNKDQIKKMIGKNSRWSPSRHRHLLYLCGFQNHTIKLAVASSSYVVDGNYTGEWITEKSAKLRYFKTTSHSTFGFSPMRLVSEGLPPKRRRLPAAEPAHSVRTCFTVRRPPQRLQRGAIPSPDSRNPWVPWQCPIRRRVRETSCFRDR